MNRLPCAPHRRATIEVSAALQPGSTRAQAARRGRRAALPAALAAALLQLAPAAASETGSAAEREPGRITLRWRTASEQNNLGFNLYRSDTPDGPWTRINQDLISGHGTTSQVHQYEFIDQPVERFRSYYYYLESISTSGLAERYSGTIHGIDDRTILGPARPAGSIALPQRLRIHDAILEPGRYDISVQTVEKEAALVNDIGTPDAGRARYVRENTRHLLLQRGGETLADELAIELPAPEGAPPIAAVWLRADTPPPEAEPRRLYRLTVRDGDRILRIFMEPAD
ncbi:MAG TPA: hypothetical protein VGB99_06690 [Acidobacteriota bacterium]